MKQIALWIWKALNFLPSSLVSLYYFHLSYMMMPLSHSLCFRFPALNFHLFFTILCGAFTARIKNKMNRFQLFQQHNWNCKVEIIQDVNKFLIISELRAVNWRWNGKEWKRKWPGEAKTERQQCMFEAFHLNGNNKHWDLCTTKKLNLRVNKEKFMILSRFHFKIKFILF